MQTEFKCFNSISILNPNGVDFGGVYSSFDYIDLSPYGGSTFTTVNSDAEVIAALSILGIAVKMINNQIIILNTTTVATDITSTLDPAIIFVNASNASTSITTQTRFNLAFYGGEPIEFIYSLDALKTRIEELTGVTTNVTASGISFVQYDSPVANVEITPDPVVQFSYNLVDTPFDSAVNNSIDLTPYGGTVVQVNSLEDVSAQFALLGINTTIDDSNISLVEFTDPTYNIELGTVNLFNVNELVFDRVLFPVEYGGSINMTSPTEIVNNLERYGINTSFTSDGSSYTFTVNSPIGTSLSDLPTEVFTIPVAINDIVEDCITSGETFILNLLGNDSLGNGETISHINGVSVIDNLAIPINNNLTIKYVTNGVIEIQSFNGYVSDLNEQVSYSITNNDNQVNTATLQFCITETPVSNPTTYELVCNTTSALLAVLATDFPAYNGLSITHINNIPIENPVSDIELYPGLTVVDINPIAGFKIEVSNNYEFSGTIAYTATNVSGNITVNGEVNFNVSSCDLCIDNNITFNTDTTVPGKLSWETLKVSGGNVNNYVLQFLDEDLNPAENAEGQTIKVAMGTFYDLATTFTANETIPFLAGTYTLEIIDSDIGSNLTCSSVGFTVSAITCNAEVSTNYNYQGLGGIASSSQFNIEVGDSSTIKILGFNALDVPDGLVVEYNGNVIYHTGESASMPYISTNVSSFECDGAVYTSVIVPDPVVVDIPINYVEGVDLAKVTIKGNACSSTIWNLEIESEGCPYVGVTDLRAQFFLQGSTYAVGDFKDQVIRVRNTGTEDSVNEINVFVSGLTAFDVVFDPNMTIATMLTQNTPVNNSNWTATVKAGGVLYTSSVVIPAGSESKIGLSTEALVAGQSADFVATIIAETGGDNNSNNNTATKILAISP